MSAELLGVGGVVVLTRVVRRDVAVVGGRRYDVVVVGRSRCWFWRYVSGAVECRWGNVTYRGWAVLSMALNVAVVGHHSSLRF